jgi:hypothetical protein
MPKTLRLAGLASGSVDIDAQEIRFALSIERAPPLSFVGKFGVVAQVIAALGRMMTELRAQMYARGGAMAPVAAEQIGTSHIQKERWSDVVLLQLITPGGVPYSFALSCADAADIADRLKTESAKPTGTGRA